jgi:gliding motility associated protien GldN
MRNLRILLTIICASVIMAGSIFSQTVGGRMEGDEKTHIPKKEPVPYKFTREADVYWSKTIWRIIDLKEKMNLPLYYPTETSMSRPNLVKLITESIKNEGTKIYDPITKVEFTVETSRDEVDRGLGAGKDSVLVDGVWKPTNKEAKYNEVTKLELKELWFFNKQYSSMEVRIVGLCPIRVYSKADPNVAVDSSAAETLEQKQLFWVYYPDVRRILTQNFVFNAKNDAQNISYDDIFTQRRFSSYIIRESNAYNDRAIIEYQNGMDVLYESERIKESIFNWEHDLWEY